MAANVKKVNTGDQVAIRIALLGPSASGKTSFLCGLRKQMVGTCVYINDESGDPTSISLSLKKIVELSGGGFFDDDDSKNVEKTTVEALALDQRINELFGLSGSSSDDMFGEDSGFKEGTETTAEIDLVFDFKIDDEPICELVISDYAGELISSPQSGFDAVQGEATAAMKMLSKQVGRADAFLVMTPINSFMEELNDHGFFKDGIEQRIKSCRISVLLEKIHDFRKDFATALFVITKADDSSVSKMPNIRANNYLEISNQIHDTFYRNVFSYGSPKRVNPWAVGVIPVSAVGDGVAETDEYGNTSIAKGRNIEPYGIDVAVCYCIYQAISRIIDEKNAQIKSISKIFANKYDKERKKKLTDDVERLQKLKTAFDMCSESYFSKITNKTVKPSELGEAR